MGRILLNPWLIFACVIGLIALGALTLSGSISGSTEGLTEQTTADPNNPDLTAPGSEVVPTTVDVGMPIADFLALSFGQMGIALALFGALITITVIFFSLKTKEAAVAEAKVEMAGMREQLLTMKDTLKTQVEETLEKQREINTAAQNDSIKFKQKMQDLGIDLQSKVDAAVREQQKAVMAANTDLTGMRKDLLDLRSQMEEQIEQTVRRGLAAVGDLEEMRLKSKDWIYEMQDLVTAKHPLSEQDTQKLSFRSSVIESKDPSDYTKEDFVTLFTQYSAAKAWDRVEELAKYAKVNFSNREIQCLGYFHLANSYYYRGEKDRAEVEYREAIEKFGNISMPEARLTIAKCRNNLITVFMNEEGWEKGLKHADEALEHLDGLLPDDEHRIRAKILINKGNCLSHLDRNEDAIKIYDQVIETLHACPDFPDKQDRLGLAHYNRACAFALLKDATASVENLTLALSFSESALADLPTDKDFLPIRDEPAFKKFLEANDLEYRL